MDHQERDGVRFVVPDGWLFRQNAGNSFLVLAAPDEFAGSEFRPNVVVTCFEGTGPTGDSMREKQLRAFAHTMPSFELRGHKVMEDGSTQVQLDSFTYELDGESIWVDQYVRSDGERGVVATASCSESDRHLVGQVLDDVAWNVELSALKISS